MAIITKIIKNVTKQTFYVCKDKNKSKRIKQLKFIRMNRVKVLQNCNDVYSGVNKKES